jgi:hypothetical protein
MSATINADKFAAFFGHNSIRKLEEDKNKDDLDLYTI